jgi:4'-phosphopantetheinyl transferase
VAASEVGARLGTVEAESGGGVAEVWFAWIGDHARDLDTFSREYLSSEERSRLPEYRIREAAERYVVTRSLVRIVLSQHIDIAPHEIRVTRTDTGKPVVTEGVHFNVTHSGELVLLAVSEDRPVGVDVERKREVARVQALVARWLTDSEKSDLARFRTRGLTESDAFLRVWSVKEARLKALGVGISGASGAPLHRVHVKPLDDLLESLVGQQDAHGYVGALAFA